MMTQKKENAYYYTGGFNLVGAAAFICGTLAYFLVYDPINYVARAEVFNYTTGTGLSCIVAGIVYLLLAQIPSVKKYLLKDSK